MVTSQRSSVLGSTTLLQLVDDGSGLVFGLGDATPPRHDVTVIAEADPPAGHAQTVRMQDEVHRPLRPY